MHRELLPPKMRSPDKGTTKARGKQPAAGAASEPSSGSDSGGEVSEAEGGCEGPSGRGSSPHSGLAVEPDGEAAAAAGRAANGRRARRASAGVGAAVRRVIAAGGGGSDEGGSPASSEDGAAGRGRSTAGRGKKARRSKQ